MSKLQAPHASVTVDVSERRTRLRTDEISESDAAHRGQMDSPNKSRIVENILCGQVQSSVPGDEDAELIVPKCLRASNLDDVTCSPVWH